MLDILEEMLESHTEKVVECFAKMVDAIDQNDTIYIDADKAKAILKAGLGNEDESVRRECGACARKPFECWTIQFFGSLVEYESVMNKTTTTFALVPENLVMQI